MIIQIDFDKLIILILLNVLIYVVIKYKLINIHFQFNLKTKERINQKINHMI